MPRDCLPAQQVWTVQHGGQRVGVGDGQLGDQVRPQAPIESYMVLLFHVYLCVVARVMS